MTTLTRWVYVYCKSVFEHIKQWRQRNLAYSKQAKIEAAIQRGDWESILESNFLTSPLRHSHPEDWVKEIAYDGKKLQVHWNDGSINTAWVGNPGNHSIYLGFCYALEQFIFGEFSPVHDTLIREKLEIVNQDIFVGIALAAQEQYQASLFKAEQEVSWWHEFTKEHGPKEHGPKKTVDHKPSEKTQRQIKQISGCLPKACEGLAPAQWVQSIHRCDRQTIVIWADDSYTVVNAAPGDVMSDVTALSCALAKRIFGTPRSTFHTSNAHLKRFIRKHTVWLTDNGAKFHFSVRKMPGYQYLKPLPLKTLPDEYLQHNYLLMQIPDPATDVGIHHVWLEVDPNVAQVTLLYAPIPKHKARIGMFEAYHSIASDAFDAAIHTGQEFVMEGYITNDDSATRGWQDGRLRFKAIDILSADAFYVRHCDIPYYQRLQKLSVITGIQSSVVAQAPYIHACCSAGSSSTLFEQLTKIAAASGASYIQYILHLCDMPFDGALPQTRFFLVPKGNGNEQIEEVPFQ
jgi:hypothetical protein